MKHLSKIGLLALASFLIVATFSLVGPRAVKAAVATLVQVVNTSANPVPVHQVENEPFEWYLCTTNPPTGDTYFDYCRGSSSDVTVPAGTSDGATVRRLVIEQFNGDCGTRDATAPVIEEVLTTTLNENTHLEGRLYAGSIHEFFPTAQWTLSGGAYQFQGFPNQLTKMYADPNTTVSLSYSGGGTDSYCQGTITGYLVTQ